MCRLGSCPPSVCSPVSVALGVAARLLPAFDGRLFSSSERLRTPPKKCVAPPKVAQRAQHSQLSPYQSGATDSAQPPVQPWTEQQQGSGLYLMCKTRSFPWSASRPGWSSWETTHGAQLGELRSIRHAQWHQPRPRQGGGGLPCSPTTLLKLTSRTSSTIQRPPGPVASRRSGGNRTVIHTDGTWQH